MFFCIQKKKAAVSLRRQAIQLPDSAHAPLKCPTSPCQYRLFTTLNLALRRDVIRSPSPSQSKLSDTQASAPPQGRLNQRLGSPQVKANPTARSRNARHCSLNRPQLQTAFVRSAAVYPHAAARQPVDNLRRNGAGNRFRLVYPTCRPPLLTPPPLH